MSVGKFTLGASVLALAAMPGIAAAAGGGAEPTAYFSVGAGVTVPDDVSQGTTITPFSGSNTFTLPSGFDTSFDTGFNVGGTIGYKFNSTWRVEGEYRYSTADNLMTTVRGGFNVPTATNPSGSLTPNSGDISVNALFANAVLDINMPGRLLPYIGAGLGYADIDISALGSDAGEGVFAYQVFLGGDVSLDDHSWVGARFNFMNTDNFAYDPVGPAAAGAFTTGKAQYSAFDLTFSYRRDFK